MRRVRWLVGEPSNPRALYLRKTTILMQRMCRDTEETEAVRDDEGKVNERGDSGVHGGVTWTGKARFRPRSISGDRNLIDRWVWITCCLFFWLLQGPVYVLSLPQRGLLHSCPRRRKRLHLVHQVLYTHDETFHTYLNQGRHQLFPSSMLTVQLARKTYLPVRRQHHQTIRSLASCPPASLISSLA